MAAYQRNISLGAAFSFSILLYTFSSMLNEKTVQDIKAFAIKNDWQEAFGGTSYGNQHLERMVKIALFLADHLGADKQLVEAAAWLHDFPLSSGHDYNYQRNRAVTSTILDQFSLTESERENIVECVAAHEGGGSATTVEAGIIHDADVLEKTGLLGIIRHTWKLVHSAHDPSVSHLSGEVRQHLHWRATQLKTTLAQEIHRYLTENIPMSDEFVKKIVTLVQPLAARNIITEDIARELKSSLSESEYKKLEEQLSLEYLHRFN